MSLITRPFVLVYVTTVGGVTKELTEIGGITKENTANKHQSEW